MVRFEFTSVTTFKESSSLSISFKNGRVIIRVKNFGKRNETNQELGARYHRSAGRSPNKRVSGPYSARSLNWCNVCRLSFKEIVPSEPRVSSQSALRLGVRFSELSAVDL